MYLGLDFGTSSVKAILIDEEQRIISSASEAFEVYRPHPSWAEQDPEDWWAGCAKALDRIADEAPKAMADVRAIGLSGQMHGATLLGKDDRPLRPCILWNDTRSVAQSLQLEEGQPKFLTAGGNRVMPGFTAPKLQWVREHEPQIFQQTAKVLLPKDYIRLCLTGGHASDMSDSAGTLWMDVAARDWCDDLLAATGLSRDHMPTLVEGTHGTGTVRPSLCQRWGWTTAPIVAGGGGDNAAAACGIGAVRPGSAFVSLGTSGVIFATTDAFRPNVESAVHAFCHAVPDTWHQMGVILSAADSLNWVSRLFGEKPADLVTAIGTVSGPSPVKFLPYLGGERTPHNDAEIRGNFSNLSHATQRGDLVQSVLEGVCLGLKDCVEALEQAGTRIDRLLAVGGGARSRTWLQILASVLNVPVDLPAEGDFGASLGAARLAQASVRGYDPDIFSVPPLADTISPTPEQVSAYEDAYGSWKRLYPALKQV
ncbi:xylulokinase [Roseibium sediminis]|uniref:xylulokinase n=1 Tax=Roseibium sediminis TaxID=1775174 RepID=UPI00123DB4C1|nr:xylulokinase [Roseibium sediminis]